MGPADSRPGLERSGPVGSRGWMRRGGLEYGSGEALGGGLKGDGVGHDGEKGDIMKKPQTSWCTTGASVCLGYGACVVQPRLAVCFGCRAEPCWANRPYDMRRAERRAGGPPVWEAPHASAGANRPLGACSAERRER